MNRIRPYPFGPDEALTLEPIYARLRDEEPVCRVHMPFGGEAWLVTRYEDAKVVLADRRFSRAATLGADIGRMFPEPDDAASILAMDPPDHTRLRRLVGPAFTAARMNELRPRVRAHAERLVDELEAHGPPADLVAGFGRRLPLQMICELLGVPDADQPTFRDWSTIAVSVQSVSKAELDAALGNLMGYIAGLVAQRRARPTGDVLGQLVAARDEDDRLSEQELVFLGVTLLVAGHETAEKAIADAVYTLLTRPADLARLRAEPDLMPSAVEELLRFLPLESCGGAFTRVVTEEVALDGTTLAPGQAVFTRLSVANRDERVFPEPDRLDFDRSPNPHLAFGYGPHTCLGAHLGRVELQEALSVLLHRFPGLRLAVEPAEVRWMGGGFVRGPESLPITW